MCADETTSLETREGKDFEALTSQAQSWEARISEAQTLEAQR